MTGRSARSNVQKPNVNSRLQAGGSEHPRTTITSSEAIHTCAERGADEKPLLSSLADGEVFERCSVG